MQRWNSKREMMGDDPPYLAVGTEVSAKYKGAFCEAKVRKVVRSVKCKVAFKLGLGTAIVTDDQIRGTLRAGVIVEAKHPDKKEYAEATITKIQDCSQYTVVFDDGDITTLRRTALCLKSGRHFAESETLDQLPLTHPEHFGNPVIGGRRGRRNRQDDSSDDEEVVRKGGAGKQRRDEKEADIGKVVCVEISEKKKQKDNWFPGLVVAPTAQDTVRIHVREEYLVRSFKDGRYYTVPKKEATPFTREIGLKVDNNTLRTAVEKALLFLDRDELPPHWDRELLFGLDETSNSDSDAAFDSDSSDDEPREEKDHFVAQLYKFMDDRGTPINKGPTISAKDVDLYKLFKVVHKLGGYNRVTNHNQWKTISHKLGFGQTASTVNLVKHAYKKFLHSFEDFYRKLGCTMVNHPRNNRARHRSNRSLIRDRDRATLVNKEKPNEKDSASDETKEVPSTSEVKKEESVKVKEEDKPKESPTIETSKSLRDCRKEIPRSRSKEDRPERKTEEKITAVKETPHTYSRKTESDSSSVKSKDIKITDEREDRIKVRDSIKATESVASSSTKIDTKQEKEPLRSRKDKDTSKDTVEKDAPLMEKEVQLKLTKVKKKDSVKESKGKQEEKEDNKLVPNKNDRDLNVTGTGRTSKKITTIEPTESNSKSNTNNNSASVNSSEPSETNNAKVKKRSIFSKVTGGTSNKSKKSPEKVKPSVQTPSKVKKVLGLSSTRQKRSLKDRVKAIVKRLKLKSNNTGSHSTNNNNCSAKETKNSKETTLLTFGAAVAQPLNFSAPQKQLILSLPSVSPYPPIPPPTSNAHSNATPTPSTNSATSSSSNPAAVSSATKTKDEDKKKKLSNNRIGTLEKNNSNETATASSGNNNKIINDKTGVESSNDCSDGQSVRQIDAAVIDRKDKKSKEEDDAETKGIILRSESSFTSLSDKDGSGNSTAVVSSKAKSTADNTSTSTSSLDNSKVPKNIQLTRSKSKEEGGPNKLKKIDPAVTNSEMKKSLTVTSSPTSSITSSSAVSPGSTMSSQQSPGSLQNQSGGNPPSISGPPSSAMSAAAIAAAAAADIEKKRGRKKKDDEKGNAAEEVLDQLPSYKSVSVGDKLKVYYGPTHESKVTYEAKVLNSKEEGSETLYLVHYTGWNTRYDEWIKRSRIADNLSWSPGRVKRNRQVLPQQKDQLSKPPSTGTGVKRGRSSTISESGGTNAAPNTSSNGTSSSSSSTGTAVSPTVAGTKRSTTPSSTVRTPPSHATRTYTRTKQRTRRISGHAGADFTESESEEEYDTDSDLETCSTSIMKKSEKIISSGDEKDESQMNESTSSSGGIAGRNRRRISSIQQTLRSDEKSKDKDETTEATTVVAKRKLLTPSSTSEDEKEGKSSKTQEEIKMERRTVTRSSVEKEIKSPDERSSSSLGIAGTERLRGRKLRSDKSNRPLSDSEDEKEEPQEQIIKKEVKRTFSDRRKTDGNVSASVKAKSVTTDKKNVTADEENDTEDVKIVRVQQKDDLRSSKSNIKCTETKTDTLSQNKIDKRKSDTSQKSIDTTDKEGDSIKDDDSSGLVRSDRLRNRSDKKKSIETKLSPSAKVIDKDTSAKGDDKSQVELLTFSERSYLKNQNREGSFESSDDTKHDPDYTDDSESPGKKRSKTDKRKSGVNESDKGTISNKSTADQSTIKDEEPSQESGERRRSRRVPIRKDEAFKQIVPKDEIEEEQPKGRDFDLFQIRSELKGIEKAVKVPIDHSEKSSDSTVRGFDTKEGGADNAKEITLVKIKKEEEEEEDDDDEVLVKPKSIDLPKDDETDVEEIQEALVKEIDLTADDIYEFKEPEPFEFEVRQKCSDEKGGKLQRRTFGRMCDDLSKNKLPLKRKLIRPAKPEIQPLSLAEERKRFKRNSMKKKEELAPPVIDSKPDIAIKSTTVISNLSSSNIVPHENLTPLAAKKSETNIDAGEISNKKPLKVNEAVQDKQSVQDKQPPLIDISSTMSGKLPISNELSKPSEIKLFSDDLEQVESADDDSEDRLVISEPEDVETESEKEIQTISSVNIGQKEDPKSIVTTVSSATSTTVTQSQPSLTFASRTKGFSFSQALSHPITLPSKMASEQRISLVSSSETNMSIKKAASVKDKSVKVENVQEVKESVKHEVDEHEEEEEEEMEDDAINAAIQRVILQSMTDDESNDMDLIAPPASLNTKPTVMNQSSTRLHTSVASLYMHTSGSVRKDSGSSSSSSVSTTRKRKTTLSREFIDDTDSDSDNSQKNESIKVIANIELKKESSSEQKDDIKPPILSSPPPLHPFPLALSSGLLSVKTKEMDSLNINKYPPPKLTLPTLLQSKEIISSVTPTSLITSAPTSLSSSTTVSNITITTLASAVSSAGRSYIIEDKTASNKIDIKVTNDDSCNNDKKTTTSSSITTATVTTSTVITNSSKSQTTTSKDTVKAVEDENVDTTEIKESVNEIASSNSGNKNTAAVSSCADSLDKQEEDVNESKASESEEKRSEVINEEEDEEPVEKVMEVGQDNELRSKEEEEVENLEEQQQQGKTEDLSQQGVEDVAEEDVDEGNSEDDDDAGDYDDGDDEEEQEDEVEEEEEEQVEEEEEDEEEETEDKLATVVEAVARKRKAEVSDDDEEEEDEVEAEVDVKSALEGSDDDGNLNEEDEDADAEGDEEDDVEGESKRQASSFVVRSDDSEKDKEAVASDQTNKVKNEEDEECVQSLLCEETIPGSPAPPTVNQKDEKDLEEADGGTVGSNSNSNIANAELPFASAPGTSLHHQQALHHHHHHQHHHLQRPGVSPASFTKPPSLVVPHQQAQMPAAPLLQPQLIQAVPVQPPPEAAPVMDNTPPTTPESSLSPISNSPRGERSGSSPGLDNDSSKSHRDSSEIDLDSFPDHNKMGNYSEEEGSGVTGGGGGGRSTSSTMLPTGTTVLMHKKQQQQQHLTNTSRIESDESPSKKRRRSRKRSEDANKRAKLARRSPRNPPGSDSDDTSENSLAGSTLDLPSSRSPKPSKYNFYIQLDPELDGAQRIAILQQKLQELRKTYMALKTELACIDRRRKKLRRREREEKSSKQEVTCS